MFCQSISQLHKKYDHDTWDITIFTTKNLQIVVSLIKKKKTFIYYMVVAHQPHS